MQADCQSTCNASTTCSNNGRCRGMDGTCICDAGFEGDDCSVELVSACPEGFSGPSCLACDENSYSADCKSTCNASTTCSNNGRCRGGDGTCICDDGYSGTDCSVVVVLSSTPAPSDTAPVIKMRIGLPLSMADFTISVQASVREAISAAAGVDASRVRILSISEDARRRLLAGLQLDIAIYLPPGSSSSLASMTAHNLNEELVARNLPAATILEPPIIVYEPIEQPMTTTPSPTTSSTTPSPTSSSTNNPTTSSTPVRIARQ